MKKEEKIHKRSKELPNVDFKITMTNMLEKLKDKMENLSKELLQRKNQMENLDEKNKITEIES